MISVLSYFCMGSPVVWSVGTDSGVNMYIGSNSCKEEEEDEGSDL